MGQKNQIDSCLNGCHVHKKEKTALLDGIRELIRHNLGEQHTERYSENIESDGSLHLKLDSESLASFKKVSSCNDEDIDNIINHVNNYTRRTVRPQIPYHKLKDIAALALYMIALPPASLVLGPILIYGLFEEKFPTTNFRGLKVAALSLAWQPIGLIGCAIGIPVGLATLTLLAAFSLSALATEMLIIKPVTNNVALVNHSF